MRFLRKLPELVLVLLILPSLLAFMSASAAWLLWQWLLAAQYGEGPGIRAWLGIASLIAILSTGPIVIALIKQKPTEGPLAQELARAAALLVAILFILGGARLLMLIGGWS